MSRELLSEMVQASVVLECLPEYAGYNGSAFVIDDTERDRIVGAINRVILAIQIHNNDKERMLAVIKAVAHIGVDFGFGSYVLEPEYIEMARAICEQEDLDT
jgi:hypothetical protein